MNPIEDFFISRKTVRKYDHSKSIEPALIAELVDAARMAPNTGNMQLYSAVVTTGADEIAALAREGHFNQPASAGAQALLTFCVDMRRFARWCGLNGTASGLGNLQGFVWSVMDTTIFAQQFVTLAELRGLGTCYLGTTTYNAEAIGRRLDLPQGVLPLITVSLGWPAEEGDRKQRLPLGAVLHFGRYADPTDDELAAIYRATEESPEARRFVEENGKPSLAHVFTEVRYPKESAETFSNIYKEEIIKAGIKI